MSQLLTRSLTFRADSVDDAHRSVKAVVATENPVDVYDSLTGRVVSEVLLLGGMTAAAHVPLLLDHYRRITQTIGSVGDLRRDGNNLEARLSFAAGTQAADEAWLLVSQRHARQVSVGYRVAEAVDIPAGQSKTVGSRTFTATTRPLRIVTRWRLREVSLVPVGADEAAMIRTHVSLSQRSAYPMSSVSIPISDAIGRQAGRMRFPELAAVALRTRGVAVPKNDRDTCRAWLATVDGISDLTGIVNAAILDGYQSAADTLAGVYVTQNCPNYLRNELGALTIHPRLERIARGDTAPAAAFGISPTGFRLGRFGVQFALDEQDLLSADSLLLYQVASRQLGTAVRRLVSDLLWSVILSNPTLGDGTALFDASRGNYATDALVDTALDAAMGAIAGQTGMDADDNPVHLGLSPRYLIVPPLKAGLARRLVRNMVNGDGQDLIVRAESRLTTAMVDPATEEVIEPNGTNWLLAAPGEQAPSLILGLLDGQAEPTVRSFRLERGEWGVGFDISLSAAATAIDGKPLYWSAGA